MKNILLLLAVVLVSCEAPVVDEIIEQVVIDTTEVTPITGEAVLSGSYEVVYIKGYVYSGGDSILADYLKWDYNFDFDANTLMFDEEASNSFSYAVTDDVCEIEYERDFKADWWFKKFSIKQYGDTVIINPIDNGEHLIIKMVKL